MSESLGGPHDSDRHPGNLAVGDPAPVFRLRRTFDSEVALEDLLSVGPVLLAFYVFDFGEI